MAPLSQNTPQPINPQEYFHWSHPISETIDEKSKAKGIEGATEAIKGISTLNKAGQEAATETGEKAGEEIQSEYGTATEAIWEKTTGKTAGDPGADRTTPDTLTPGASPVP